MLWRAQCDQVPRRGAQRHRGCKLLAVDGEDNVCAYACVCVNSKRDEQKQCQDLGVVDVCSIRRACGKETKPYDMDGIVDEVDIRQPNNDIAPRQEHRPIWIVPVIR